MRNERREKNVVIITYEYFVRLVGSKIGSRPIVPQRVTKFHAVPFGVFWARAYTLGTTYVGQSGPKIFALISKYPTSVFNILITLFYFYCVFCSFSVPAPTSTSLPFYLCDDYNCIVMVCV